LHIIINGENKELPETLSVAELIRQLELPQMRVAIEINREVVRRADWMLTLLRDGDRVEIVQFVGGGSTPENL
jgi:thiamine biosynthesis protein ThiS